MIVSLKSLAIPRCTDHDQIALISKPVCKRDLKCNLSKIKFALEFAIKTTRKTASVNV